MVTRRVALGAFAAVADLLLTGGDLRATDQDAALIPRPPVFQHDLPNVSLDEWEVTVNYVDYAPGRVGAPHRHPGFVLAYVLEGAVVTKISGEATATTYTAGQMFYEPPGTTHEVSKNASATAPAKLLAFVFAKKGSTLTTPVPHQRE